MLKHSAAVLLSVVLLYGCTDTPTPTPPSTPSAPAPSPSSSSIEVATEGAINEETDETISAEPIPTWDEAAESAARDTAITAMTAFARPELSYDDWWAQLQPLLTQEAAETYVYTDPINIPVTKVTGDATVVESSSAYLALVDVDTNVGTYQVLMVRTDDTTPWLAGEFAPPPNLGP